MTCYLSYEVQTSIECFAYDNLILHINRDRLKLVRQFRLMEYNSRIYSKLGLYTGFNFPFCMYLVYFTTAPKLQYEQALVLFLKLVLLGWNLCVHLQFAWVCVF